ncbi:N-acetylmuramoyl-L-alanine amidase-like [Xyrichtys novacula]|uniref:N-acetylmuramoyl-L-alanine amidase-like n=1 Tax=Xyrichtys novacula TaxID=13765 RepID=A0AAV1GRF1_XYRNO|nr:N-acetylmuramoyl-L-alanine amidase-like [Xyrichtys novacula]
MERSCGKQILVLVLVLISTHAEALFSRHMQDFIRAVQQVEDQDPESKPLSVLRSLRKAGGLIDAFIQHFLGDADSGGSDMTSDLSAYISRSVQHRVSEDAAEEGVVLTPDGTTVSLTPLLLGLEAGLLSKSNRSVRGLYQLTLTKDLDQAQRFGSPKNQLLGPDGCWDSVTQPQVFTLLDSPALLTTAQINGGMDGVVLGMEVSDRSRHPLKLSRLLMEYYCHQLDTGGLDSAPRLISRRRRDNFRELVEVSVLSRGGVSSVELQRRLEGRPKMEVREKKQLKAMLRKGVREFVSKFIGCPPIIPRCMWRAEPYRGTPTNLSLPLSFMFIHHTFIPGQPCLTFRQCSQDMRSMQRFHQDDRGWDDIGYR